MDAPEICGGIGLRIWRSWDGNVWYRRLRETVFLWGLHRALERAIALKGAAVRCRLRSNSGFALLAAKQAHGGSDYWSKTCCKGNGTGGGGKGERKKAIRAGPNECGGSVSKERQRSGMKGKRSVWIEKRESGRPIRE